MVAKPLKFMNKEERSAYFKAIGSKGGKSPHKTWRRGRQTHIISIYFQDLELRAWITTYCQSMGRSMSWWVEETIKEFRQRLRDGKA